MIFGIEKIKVIGRQVFNFSYGNAVRTKTLNCWKYILRNAFLYLWKWGDNLGNI